MLALQADGKESIYAMQNSNTRSDDSSPCLSEVSLRQFNPPMCMSMHKNIRFKTPNSKIIAVWGQVGQSSFTTCLFGRTCAHLTAADLTLPPDHLDRQSGDGGGVLMMRCRF